MHTPTNIVIVLTYLACLAAAQNPCITSCTGLPDGDYQSCKGCKVFATCWHEKLFDDRPCVGNTVWDDSFKRCELSSATCTPLTCVSNCQGLADGNYESCSSCNVYVTCHAGNIVDNRPCPAGLVFNNETKGCAHTSPLCH
ncbi:uncharacterized protein LOC124269770 [Haliotis rubra]|uniref:uncharacterized protein LOC124269770 n=1 Tax=Haliotis rubra TaxID=36100 RepID=UPI001EE592D6|nr:uncharacterized protein LOC124269770 [Haliotis rubra]